jgi:hypothetical protein
VDKYLEGYAERGTAAVAGLPGDSPWQQTVVIPVCNESTGILRPLPPLTGRSLMILVVNEVEGSPDHVSAANQAFAAEVAERFNETWQSGCSGGLALYSDPDSPRDVLLVDRFSKGLRWSRKGGVGHARKTGADLAAFLVNRNRIQSPWIHCSDADVVLPGRYFTCSGDLDDEASSTTAALIYPFRHVSTEGAADDKVDQATQLYEYSLRYYVAGLVFAGSPYAFHTIGSTMAVNASHYCKVRGFPRRQAGEDFYLLNKLAKVGSVRQLDEETECEPIKIAARLSDRVPFGTGAAVGKMMELKDPIRDFRFYHPRVFSSLKAWLDSLPIFWQQRSSKLTQILSPLDLDYLIRPLRDAGASEALDHSLRQSSNAVQFARHMNTWFDAFRTLKLIHYLRDCCYPPVGFEALVKHDSLRHLLPLEPVLASLHHSQQGVRLSRSSLQRLPDDNRC